MKRVFLFIVFLAACDTSPADNMPIGGRWIVGDPGAALIGECCNLSLILQATGEDVRGAGELLLPGIRIGSTRKIPVLVEGSVRPSRAFLSIKSGSKSGALTGKPAPPGKWYEYEADFTGFGYSVSGLKFGRLGD